uniref:Uncharacterized protein n=1 Tax=Kalanchoe fedtschenkoi TaxID=63787 RepID=A0A7N0TRB6_KALFE
MGLLPCRSKRHSATPDDYRPNLITSASFDLSKPSLISQPSLPSVPTLTHQPSTNHLDRYTATLTPHTSSIFALTISAHNSAVLSASSDGEIRAQTPTSSAVVVPAARCAVKALLVFSNKLVTAHQDSRIRVYRIDESSRLYALEATLPTLADRARTMVSPRSYVKVRRHVRRTWVHHVDAVSALALSSDKALLYSVSWDRSLKVWRTSDFRCVESVVNAHDDAVNAVVVAGDGRVFTGSADKMIKVWRRQRSEEGVEEHRVVETLTKHRSAVNALALSRDGSVLYSGACDRSILVWSDKNATGAALSGGGMVVVGALRGHTKAILCLCVVGDLLFSGSADGTVRVWRRGGGGGYGCVGVLGRDGGAAVKSVAAMEVAGGAYLVYGGSLDGEIKVWELRVDSVN